MGMGVTLVVNPGSTSKKYALYHGDQRVYTAHYEKTIDGFSVCRTKGQEQQKCDDVSSQMFLSALGDFLAAAVEAGVIAQNSDVTAVGIRIVAPGSFFAMHRAVDDAFTDAMQKLSAIVPIHVPIIIDEINVVQELLPKTPCYGISDSAFHQSVPNYRRSFAVKQPDTGSHEIKRYGYHGLSMTSLTRRLRDFFGVVPDRIVALHVGGGISATALHYEESVDTTMGYSPASGIMMGSRVGRLEADAMIALMSATGMRSIATLATHLNRDSGFQAMLGYSDLRMVVHEYTNGNQAAIEAMEMFRYQLHREVGGHIAVLGGLDAVVMTGTAVVRNPFLRSFLLDGLEGFGMTLNKQRNDALVGHEGMIHDDHSDTPIGVMKTDEMGEIARATIAMTDRG